MIRRQPEWARWPSGADAGGWTLGVEEEVMLLRPESWDLAQEHGSPNWWRDGDFL